ncbi:MAG: 2-oxo acid dehydrogenase subunit E2, partial [Deltaproteobacteria bacterium]|nr:2-oxo acid dehydrogenase subunit E2 [Deltaproteobacteria bacterium]
VYLSAVVNAEAIAAWMDEKKARGAPVPLTAILLKGLGLSVREHPEARTLYYSPPPRLVRFDDCHVTIPVEREVEGERMVIFANVKDCDSRSIRDLTYELRKLRDAPIDEIPEFAWWVKMAKFPRLVRKAIYLPMQYFPAIRATGWGTFGLTNIGSAGVDDFLPLAAATVTFGVGALKERPVAENGLVVARKTLALTLMFDHRAIDGYPAARFFQDCAKRLEKPDFLE